MFFFFSLLQVSENRKTNMNPFSLKHVLLSVVLTAIFLWLCTQWQMKETAE